MEGVTVRTAVLGLLLGLVGALPDKDDWQIYSFNINSTVIGRYATTVITSRVVNRRDESKEVEFEVQIPKNAFITKFRMFMEDQVYDGLVKAKKQAEEQYSGAVARGESAGIVSSVGRTLEKFKTSVNVAALKKVTFELTYEELLKRRLGKYELLIHARPLQPVRDFKVDVTLEEDVSISFLEVKGRFAKGALASAVTKTHEDKKAWVHFYPTEEQQKACDGCGEQGLNGDLVVVYDVQRDNNLGDITTSEGYFVHHFAPFGLPSLPKNVVFMIDRSGSMSGTKIEQTRRALVHILSDLSKDDFFGLITFNSRIFHWKPELVQANDENLESAKTFARNIEDGGGTDINTAVLAGAEMLKDHTRDGSASFLVLLTDGDPTSGETNLEAILSNVRKAINKKFPLYCLGFGFDVNFNFLEKMSLQNDGIARRIYEDSDADLQLKGFYEEVATPLLTNVLLIYNGGSNLTQTNFSQYYNGSEIVVAGQITDNNVETFSPEVLAISNKANIQFVPTRRGEGSFSRRPDGLLQRIWAYLTVKNLLEKELLSSGDEKERVVNETLRLSLKYGFVTPLTSMVVTKPPGDDADVLHKPKEGKPAPVGTSSSRSMMYQFSGTARGGYGGYSRKGHRGPPGLSLTDSSLGSGYPVRFRKIGLGAAPPAMATIIDQGVENSLRGGPPPSGGRYAVDLSLTADDLMTLTTERPPVTVLSSNFLLGVQNETVPLCPSLPINKNLKLLHLASGGLQINGKMDPITLAGFETIMVHLGPNHYIDLTPDYIYIKQGSNVQLYMGQNPFVVKNATLTRQGRQVDIAVGEVHIRIMVQEKDGNKFLWPVLMKRPSDDAAEGLLALETLYMGILPTNGLMNVKIKDRQYLAARVKTMDYGTIPAAEVPCWKISVNIHASNPWGEFVVAVI